MAFNYLALDGGGIRGYMTARILNEIEAQSGVSVTDPGVVDGYCGTSTGGLLSIALAVGHTPEDLAKLYKDRATEIFENNDSDDTLRLIKFLAKFYDGFKRLISGVGVFDSQYRAHNLKKIAEGLAGSQTFGDIAANRLLAVNTVALEVPGLDDGWRAATFSNHNLQQLTRTRTTAGQDPLADTRNVSLVDGALSTSAAPSYFPPHKVVRDGTSLGYFADGGTFANNPVMNGFAIATGVMGHKIADLSVLSIGTGMNTQGIPEKAIPKPLEFGVLDWFGAAKHVPSAALLNIMMSCSAENMTEIADTVLGKRVVRLNPILPENDPIPLDATDKFGVMDKAVEALFKTQDFADAVALVKAWSQTPPAPLMTGFN